MLHITIYVQHMYIYTHIYIYVLTAHCFVFGRDIVSPTLIYSFDVVFLEFMNIESYRKNILIITVIYSIVCLNTYNLLIHSTINLAFLLFTITFYDINNSMNSLFCGFSLTHSYKWIC